VDSPVVLEPGRQSVILSLSPSSGAGWDGVGMEEAISVVVTFVWAGLKIDMRREPN
jgi:hypothetical protein